MSVYFDRRSGRFAMSLLAACLAASTGGALATVVAGAPQSGQTAQRSAAPTSGARAKSRITRIQIDSVESPTFDGREFGTAGKFERLLGRLYGELDPGDARNAFIVDLDHAPRNAQGMVEYSADFRIVKPIDMARGAGTLFYDVVNRGAQRALNLHVGLKGPYGSYPPAGADFGDGFLFEQGFTVVWSGWQGDVTPATGRLVAQLPIAKLANGKPIRRWVTTEFLSNGRTNSVHLQGDAARSYPAVEESMPKAQLYRRSKPHAEPELIPRNSWSFARCTGEGAPVPSNVDLCVPAGLSSNYIYYLSYEAQDPIVMGVGFAAVRDFVSFLRRDTTQANPLVARRGSAAGGNPIRRAILFGQSQSGRFARDFIYQGANEDLAGGMVFEGAIPQTAGSRKTYTNEPFSEPGRFARAVEDHYSPGDQYPFTFDTMTDPVSGRVDGILMRCRLTSTCPKIMQWDSGSEAWVARASLVTTDPLGMTDLALPDNVRYYYFASTQHQAGTSAEPSGESRGNCQQQTNPNPYRDGQRALLVAMQSWLGSGRLPPSSQYPKIADGTLVPPMPQTAQGYPAIPGVKYTGKLNDMYVNDQFASPARHIGPPYTVLVPKTDRDGNDLAGIRSTVVQAPIGTYAGWNLRREGSIGDEVCGTNGSYVPFARKAADRGADPRLSLEERYHTHKGYVDQVRAATERLKKDGFLLQQDADRLIREAEQRDLGLPK